VNQFCWQSSKTDYISTLVQWLKWLHCMIATCVLEICLVTSCLITEMQIYWFVTIDVLGGATGTRSAIVQGHLTEGADRWLPPPSSITLVSEVNLWSIVVVYEMLNYHESLYEHYEGSIVVLYWTLTIMNSCVSIMKDVSLYYTKGYLSWMFIWVLRRIYCCIVLNINYHE